MLASYGVRTFAGRHSGAHGEDIFASAGWKLTPRSNRVEERELNDSSRPRWFGRLAAGLSGLLVGATMLTAAYLAPDRGHERVAYSHTHTHVLPVVEANRRSQISIGENAPDSLWGIAEAYIGDDLPQEDVSRVLVEATDALAQDNEYCAPTTWADEYPDRVDDSTLERHLEVADCEDGSPNPHYIERGAVIDTSALEEYVTDDTRTIETYIRADVDDPGETDPTKGLLALGGLAALVTGAGLLATQKREDRGPTLEELEGVDPNDRPRENATLVFGHRYLASKDYLERTDAQSDRKLAGAARSSVEGKASRLNKVAAALESSYLSDDSSLEDVVRGAVGEVSDRTADSYVKDLAEMGHEGAKRYREAKKAKRARKKSAKSRSKKG